MQFFQGSGLLVSIPAWGFVNLEVQQLGQSEAGNRRVRKHTLSVKVAPRTDGRRGVLADLNEVADLGDFTASDTGNVYLGTFVAVPTRGQMRIGFLPSKDFDRARLTLSMLSVCTGDFADLLGGDDEGVSCPETLF